MGCSAARALATTISRTRKLKALRANAPTPLSDLINSERRRRFDYASVDRSVGAGSPRRGDPDVSGPTGFGGLLFRGAAEFVADQLDLIEILTGL